MAIAKSLPNDKENPALDNWVKRQRCRFKNGGLDREREQQLAEIGFVWTAAGNPRR
jgi:hypothetical protein